MLTDNRNLQMPESPPHVESAQPCEAAKLFCEFNSANIVIDEHVQLLQARQRADGQLDVLTQLVSRGPAMCRHE